MHVLYNMRTAFLHKLQPFSKRRRRCPPPLTCPNFVYSNRIRSPEKTKVIKNDNGRTDIPPSLPSGFKPAPEGPRPLLLTPPSTPPLGVVTRGDVPVGELMDGVPLVVVGVAVVDPGTVVLVPLALEGYEQPALLGSVVVTAAVPAKSQDPTAWPFLWKKLLTA